MYYTKPCLVDQAMSTTKLHVTIAEPEPWENVQYRKPKSSFHCYNLFPIKTPGTGRYTSVKLIKKQQNELVQAIKQKLFIAFAQHRLYRAKIKSRLVLSLLQIVSVFVLIPTFYTP